jgi:hypothetical protein
MECCSSDLMRTHTRTRSPLCAHTRRPESSGPRRTPTTATRDEACAAAGAVGGFGGRGCTEAAGLAMRLDDGRHARVPRQQPRLPPEPQQRAEHAHRRWRRQGAWWQRRRARRQPRQPLHPAGRRGQQRHRQQSLVDQQRRGEPIARAQQGVAGWANGLARPAPPAAPAAAAAAPAARIRTPGSSPPGTARTRTVRHAHTQVSHDAGVADFEAGDEPNSGDLVAHELARALTKTLALRAELLVQQGQVGTGERTHARTCTTLTHTRNTHKWIVKPRHHQHQHAHTYTHTHAHANTRRCGR